MDFEKPHRRFNPLTGDWVLISPHRIQRPWQGKVETLPSEEQPRYDPACYLCPGNERAGGKSNPKYESVFVFENDFPALIHNPPDELKGAPAWMQSYSESGVCRVICYSPRHDATLEKLNDESVLQVIDEWVKQYEELSSMSDIGFVQIFENKGEMMGCSCCVAFESSTPKSPPS